MTKRSVYDRPEIYSPLHLLELAKSAYAEQFINDEDRLAHAAYVCTAYLGAFRINEELSLIKSQFKKRLSLEKREFLVIEHSIIEKSGGRLRNIAIFPQDPLAIPLLARLSAIQEDGRLFPFKERTARYFIDRVSNGQDWPHFFRAQRNRFLSQGFSREERERIIGWASMKPANDRSFRHTADIYDSLNWMWYADRLARLTESYWASEPIEGELKAWLELLKAESD